MAIPGLPPSRVRAKVFRAFVTVLKSDPVLKRVVKTFRTWEGTPYDDDPPTEAQLPWVRLTPTALPATRDVANRTLSPLGIRIEVALPGTNADDALAFWEAIESAMYPSDGSVLRKLREAGAFDGPAIELPAIGISQVGDGTHVLAAEGLVSIRLRVASQP